MKVNTNKYVQILYEALEGKNDEDVKKIIASFVKLLSSDNQLRYRSRVITKFEELYNKKNGVVGVEVISKEKLGEGAIKQIKAFFKKREGVNEVDLKNKLNPEMLGGVIIRSKEEMVEASIDGQLKQIAKVLHC